MPSLASGKKSQSSKQDRECFAEFESRGRLQLHGACYYDEKQLAQLQYRRSTKVGMSYRIKSIRNIDMVKESFEVDLNLSFRYKIDEADVTVYEKLKEQGMIKNIHEAAKELEKEMAKNAEDKQGIKVKPPHLEVTNSHDFRFEKWQVNKIAKCLDPQCLDPEGNLEGNSSWYVYLSCRLEAVCHEDLELEHFPFMRQSMQIHIQACQLDSTHLLLVPYHEPSVQPHMAYEAMEGDKEKRLRKLGVHFNTMSCDRELGTWDVENHHVAFPPDKYLTKKPSGAMSSEAIITIQCRHVAAFSLWNTVPVIAVLPMLAGMAFLEEIDNVADRAGIVLAILLTLAAYKVSISSWMPKKRYLTYLDRYCLVGFVYILLIGMLVGLSGTFATLFPSTEDDTSTGSPRWRIHRGEQSMLVFSFIAWLIAHIVFLFRKNKLWDSWEKVLGDENRKLEHLASIVEEESNAQKEAWERAMTQMRAASSMQLAQREVSDEEQMVPQTSSWLSSSSMGNVEAAAQDMGGSGAAEISQDTHTTHRSDATAQVPPRALGQAEPPQVYGVRSSVSSAQLDDPIVVAAQSGHEPSTYHAGGHAGTHPLGQGATGGMAYTAGPGGGSEGAGGGGHQASMPGAGHSGAHQFMARTSPGSAAAAEQAGHESSAERPGDRAGTQDRTAGPRGGGGGGGGGEHAAEQRTGSTEGTQLPMEAGGGRKKDSREKEKKETKAANAKKDKSPRAMPRSGEQAVGRE